MQSIARFIDAHSAEKGIQGMDAVYAGIDAGGTTFKCGIANVEGELLDGHRVKVTNPEDTLAGCRDFFREAIGKRKVAGMGIASFGPIDVDAESPSYGTILDTPKRGWAGTNLRSFFLDAFGIAPAIDTDVNGALLAEMKKGAAKGAASAGYITVGTGIGAGLYQNGAFIGRPSHPEFGHIPIQRHRDDLNFDGVCPFHGDCLEGLASVTAMRSRWGEPKDLDASHPGWDVIADYLAQACRSLTLTLRLETIVLGGGLMLAPHLLGRVRTAYDTQMAGYLGAQGISGAQLIHTPALGDDAGLIGALLLGIQADGVNPV